MTKHFEQNTETNPKRVFLKRFKKKIVNVFQGGQFYLLILLLLIEQKNCGNGIFLIHTLSFSAINLKKHIISRIIPA